MSRVTETLGKRIRNTREDRDITQEELAAMLGVKENTVRRWEKNETEVKSENLKNIAKALHVSSDYLLGLTQISSVSEDIITSCKTLGITEEVAQNLIGSNGKLNGLLSNSELIARVGSLYESYMKYASLANDDEPIEIIESPKGYVYISPGHWAMELAHSIGLCFENHLLNELETEDNNGKS